MSKIRVKLVYRNYKPLHKIHESLVTYPPENVSYIVPKPIKHIGGLLKFYRMFGDNVLVSKIIKLFQKIVFTPNRSTDDTVDLLHFINIISEKIPNIPYIVEFEHPLGLTNFSADKEYMDSQVFSFLSNPKCKYIVCMSEASKRTLKKIFQSRYNQIESRVVVIYPATKIELSQGDISDGTFVKNTNALKLLFVGNDSYRKGLDETLLSLSKIQKKYGDEAVELYVVSNDAKKVIDKYRINNIFLHEPNFSKLEIIEYFFKKADYFIMPTKLDTFGMVFVDALAAGTPVISTTQYAVPEIVTNKKDGLLVSYNGLLDNEVMPTRAQTQTIDSECLDQELAESIYGILEKCIQKPSLRATLSSNTSSKFTGNGKLSVHRRNRQFKQVYQKALLK